MKKKGLIGLISTLSLAGATAVASVGIAVANNKHIEENPSYTITFETNGGDTIASTQISGGQYLTGPTASRPGYDFLGWYTDAQCTKLFDFYATPISSNITLYAKWGVKYTVTFDSKGGSEIESVRVVEGNQLVEPTEQPTKSGYIFAGWCSDKGSNNLYDFNQPVNENIILYAKWEVAYTVTFDTCGGELMTAQQVANGSQITIETPTWGNYKFQGWYLDENYETALSSDYSITENITLYAKWPINIDEYYNFTQIGKTYEIKSYKQKNNETVTELYLPNSYHGFSISSIDKEAFQSSRNLTKVILPDTISSIGAWAFSYCSVLTYINIPQDVAVINEYAFNGCYKLASIIIPSDVIEIGRGAFANCNSLTSIIIPDGVTFIGERTFSSCYSMSSVIIPDGVTFIGEGAFNQVGFETFAIPKKVNTICKDAFSNCENLTEIIIPKSVITIDGIIFYNCPNLTKIYLESDLIPSGWSSQWNASCNARVLLYGINWEYDENGIPVEIQK